MTGRESGLRCVRNKKIRTRLGENWRKIRLKIFIMSLVDGNFNTIFE